MTDLMELCEKEPKMRLPEAFYGIARSLSEGKSEMGKTLKYKGFLHGVDCAQEKADEVGACPDGYKRIDVPVWFGDCGSAATNRRISIVGSEPHNRDEKFNIVKCDKTRLVYGCPFGAEQWNRDVNREYSETVGLCLEPQGVFLHLTDVVKEYSVTADKEYDKKQARANFCKLADEWHDFLLSELDAVRPNLIIALGERAYRRLVSALPHNLYAVEGVRHPARGGQTCAALQIRDLLAKYVL